MYGAMKRLSAWVALLLLCSAFAGTGGLHLDQKDEPEKAFPVSRVVDLLREMKDNLEKEADEDEAVYEELAKWCETNDKEKTKAIADAETHLTNLQSTIEKMIALSSTLEVEIDGLEKEVAKNQKALEMSISLREKEKAEFLDEEKEMIESIRALQAAVEVLKKHHGGSALMQLRKVASAAQALLVTHHGLFEGTISPSQKRALAFFAQLSDEKQPTFKAKYEAQSGEIFGILSQMKDTFEENLSQAQKDEVAAQQSFADLKAAKEKEIKSGMASLQDKKDQLANAQDKLIQSKEDREDTTASLSADEKFLIELKDKCIKTDDEWEVRQKTRAEELEAVRKAIDLLSSDEARDLFAKTTTKTVSLVQTSRASFNSKSRRKAAAVLKAAAGRSGNPKMALLATAVQLDPFTRVKKAIDDLAAELAQEKADEIKHRDYCVEELAQNERDMAREYHTKKNLISKKEGLEMRVQEIQKTIDTLEGEIVDLKASRVQASKDRELEKKEYDEAVAEQRQTQQLLTEAMNYLKKVYEEKAAELLQKRRASPHAPTRFTTYEKQEGAQPVIAMLEHIIADSKAMEQEATDAEAEARDAYYAFVEETTKTVEVKEDAIVDRKSEKAAVKQDLEQTKVELSDTLDRLEQLHIDEGTLHKDCDYILKNFEERQLGRDQEIAALREAKSYLSGMKQF